VQHKNPITGKYEEKHMKNRPPVLVDHHNHVYTLVIRRDNFFNIMIDGQSVRNGSMLTEFEPPFTPPKLIDDPTDIKPTDWVEEAK
jgi:calnexin